MSSKSDAVVQQVQLERVTEGPQPGELYRHFKGGEYEVLYRSVEESTLAHLVTYRSLKHGSVWTRTLANFTELVGDVPRFARMERDAGTLHTYNPGIGQPSK